MKKRGQLLGQPIVMIFALIVGALILAWGIFQAYKLMNIAREVEVADYVTTLRKDVERYYYFEPGSSGRFKVSLPSYYNYICFASHEIPFFGSTPKPPNYNAAFVALRNNSNIFVYSQKEVLTYNVPYLRAPANQNPLCVKNQMNIMLTSRGTYVEVSKGS
ncbi:MAG: hypothetical protein ABIH63_00805 [archaeon]